MISRNDCLTDVTFRTSDGCKSFFEVYDRLKELESTTGADSECLQDLFEQLIVELRKLDTVKYRTLIRYVAVHVTKCGTFPPPVIPPVYPPPTPPPTPPSVPSPIPTVGWVRIPGLPTDTVHFEYLYTFEHKYVYRLITDTSIICTSRSMRNVLDQDSFHRFVTNNIKPCSSNWIEVHRRDIYNHKKLRMTLSRNHKGYTIDVDPYLTPEQVKKLYTPTGKKYIPLKKR